jgi:hypothetical protein
MGTGSQQVSGEFERSDGLLTLHGGKVIKELKGVPVEIRK